PPENHRHARHGSAHRHGGADEPTPQHRRHAHCHGGDDEPTPQHRRHAHCHGGDDEPTPQHQHTRHGSAATALCHGGDDEPAPASHYCHGHAPPAWHAAPAGSWTCPMHPEVVRDAPGSCPSCGMALEPAGPPVRAATQWTCPMHPEIVRDEPGSCPICGMALEPTTVEAEQEDPELRSMSRRFWVSLAATIPVLVVAMGDMLPGAPISRVMGPGTRTFVELALAIPVCT